MTIANYLWMFFAIIFAFIGPFVASYLTVVVVRRYVKSPKSHIERSQCLECGHVLRWYELIPLLSFLWVRGKCSQCKNKIDPRMWFAEVLGLITFIPLAIRCWNLVETSAGVSELANTILLFAFLYFLLYTAIVDMFTYAIEFNPTAIFLAVTLILSVVLNIVNFLTKQTLLDVRLATPSYLLAGLIAGGAIWSVIVFTKQRGMGEGDIYIAATIGLFLGWPETFMALYFAVIVGGFFGILYAVTIRKIKNVVIPFVPFLLIGSAMAIIWGRQLFALLFYV
jgi:leader peptidase (prepilin peptidase) / N-methyltransferase